MNHFLVIDCGTGSGRAIVFDERGKEIGISQREWTHKNFSNVPGAIDFDTATNWELLKDIIKEAIKKSGVNPESIAAVSSSSMREGMVMYDDEGKEIWACSNVDARAASEVRELIDSGIELDIYGRTGQTFSLSDAPRILWVKKNEPKIYENVSKIGMISDWVLYRLCDEYCVEPSNASTSGIFNTFTRSWDPDILETLGIKSCICPNVLEPGDILGEIKPNLAREFGILPGTRIIVGGGDVQLGTVGVGAVKEHDAVIFGGTFWQQEVNVSNPVPHPKAGVRINSHALRGLFQYEGIAFQVGLVMRWFRDAFCTEEKAIAAKLGISAYSLLSEMAKSVPAGSYGIMPFFSDVMNYMHWKHAAPSFMNFNINEPEKYSKKAMFRSLMENAAMISYGNLKVIEEAVGFFPEEITFAGGASYSPEWCRILSNVIGIPVKVPIIKEATSFGVLLTCLVGMKYYDDFDKASKALCKTEAIYVPDRDENIAYAQIYENWRSVYSKILKITDEENLNHMWKAPGE